MIRNSDTNGAHDGMARIIDTGGGRKRLHALARQGGGDRAEAPR